jgi:hypothetical protein
MYPVQNVEIFSKKQFTYITTELVVAAAAVSAANG